PPPKNPASAWAPSLSRASGQGEAALAPRRAASGAARDLVVIELVYETHSTTVEKEGGRATGWLPGELSTAGREQARALGGRRRNDGLDAVFCSDLARAVETARIAFDGSEIPLFLDWRLRECNYGELNGRPVAELDPAKASRVDEPYPGGDSHPQGVGRVE